MALLKTPVLVATLTDGDVPTSRGKKAILSPLKQTEMSLKMTSGVTQTPVVCLAALLDVVTSPCSPPPAAATAG